MAARKKPLFVLCAIISAFPMAANSATDTVNFGNVDQIIDGIGASSAWSGRLSAAQMDVFFKDSTARPDRALHAASPH